MAETDYNEILLEAIDAIVVSRISEVNFDRTIVATIVDASKAKDGEYVLSDGSVQFTVHNSSDKYKENDRVNVLIPSNDFSSTEKTILGKTSANANGIPITYVSPLEKIVPMGTNYAAGLKGGITANSETEIFQLTNAEWIEVNESTLGYDTLCVSARFKTLLNDYDIRQGRYGLLVQLKTKNGYMHALTLDSAKDMFGNPYGYSMYLTQEQTYHLNLQDNIIGIKIDLYQMKDFKYNDGVNSELQVLPVMPYNNILIDNINVSFGYNAEQVEDNTVKIGTADSLTYDNIKDASVTKKLTLTWYNKDENNKYLGFADGAFADLSAAQTAGSQKYYIKWEHSLNNGQWEELQETGQEQELTVNLNMAWALNEYRAIVVFDGVSYTSNIIQFKNATGIDNPQERLQMLLTLHNVIDSSYDSYPLYGSDGMVINPLDATQNRKVYFSYSSEIGGSLEPDVLKGATAYFYIPQNSTMLEVPAGETNWDDDQDGNHSKAGYVAYVKRFSKEQTEPTVEEKTFLYRIKANYNPLFTNNSVILRIVDKNGFIYETSKTFAFSSYGTSGTDYSIIISGANGENGWVGLNEFTPKAQLYDANYKEITDINWTWSKYPTGTTINANLSLSSITTLYQAIKAQTTISWVGKNVQISGIYPIPYSADEDYMYQGPTTIVYNSNGVKPSYYNGDLGIFKKSDNSEVTCTWSIEYFTKSNAAVSGDKEPWLSWGELTETKDGYTRFKPSSMYLGDTYYLVLVAKNNTTILWRQPLIILQNQYASGLLNNWDGNLIVDNENNYILSSMMGAGSKDSQNRFSGVLMGEVSKVADNTAETGLFGYHEGAQSFGFKTDGKAFIGKSGTGRIEFDGDYGVIKSAKYGGDTLQSSGSKWDLANGSLIMDGANGYFKFNEDNNGKLEMKLSGADIILQDEDQNLTTYISTTVDGIRSTVESYIIDYTGVGTLAAPDANYFDVTIQNYEGNLDDIFTPGAALLVKFQEDNTNGQYRYLNIVGSDIDNSRDGQTGFQVYLNGKLIRPDNPLTWLKDDEITFILQELRGNKYWVVGNKSIYSTISQTVNSIKAEVVSNTVTGEKCSWNLTGNGFYVNTGKEDAGENSYVLRVNENGLDIKGAIISDTEIKVGGTDISPAFRVDKDGNVTLNGSITWGANASPTLVLYAKTQLSKPNKAYTNYKDSSDNDWHKIATSADKYCSYTYDGGESWTVAIAFVGQDGSAGASASEQWKSATQVTTSLARNYTLALWNQYGIGYNGTWSEITNASSFKAGDIAIITGSVTETVGTAAKTYGTVKNYLAVESNSSTSLKGTIIGQTITWNSNSPAAYVMASLNSETTDGIYKYAENGNVRIGINATAIKAGQINADLIKTGSLTIKNNDQVYLSINAAGGDNSVTIGGFSITGNKFVGGTMGTDGFIGIYKQFNTGDGNQTANKENDSTTINGHQDTSWRLIIGPNFGVNNKGYLYAKDAHISGIINVTSGGTIGDWTIGSGNDNSLAGAGLKYTADQTHSAHYRGAGDRYQQVYNVTIKDFVMSYMGISYSIRIDYSHQVDTQIYPIEFSDFDSLSSLLNYYGVASTGTLYYKTIRWAKLGSI